MSRHMANAAWGIGVRRNCKDFPWNEGSDDILATFFITKCTSITGFYKIVVQC